MFWDCDSSPPGALSCGWNPALNPLTLPRHQLTFLFSHILWCSSLSQSSVGLVSSCHHIFPQYCVLFRTGVSPTIRGLAHCSKGQVCFFSRALNSSQPFCLPFDFQLGDRVQSRSCGHPMCYWKTWSSPKPCDFEEVFLKQDGTIFRRCLLMWVLLVVTRIAGVWGGDEEVSDILLALGVSMGYDCGAKDCLVTPRFEMSYRHLYRWKTYFSFS
jgi:hypothetical protein